MDKQYFLYGEYEAWKKTRIRTNGYWPQLSNPSCTKCGGIFHTTDKCEAGEDACFHYDLFLNKLFS